MTKAIFSEKQPKVRVTSLDGENYFQISLNEEEVTEIHPAMDESEETEEIAYQYDFNSWHDHTTSVEDVKNGPEKYLDYSPSAVATEKTPTFADRLKSLEEQQETANAALQDLILMQEG